MINAIALVIVVPFIVFEMIVVVRTIFLVRSDDLENNYRIPDRGARNASQGNQSKHGRKISNTGD